ncbi:histidine kinase [Paenibacillus sp. HB172176]|uniref:sensor histidine kinase n=1 Tax=Paenibacillus sp. HB172176 TaxID=2493690 RepID=UPI00143C1579|nr:histidine kinase [Paenibacillus sp. HB172176]
MRRGTLFHKLLLALVISVSLPVVLLGYVSYDRSKDQIEEVARVFLSDNVNQNAQRMERVLTDAESLSEKALASQELQQLLKSPSPASFSDEIAFIQEMNTLISELKGPYELYVFPLQIDKFPNYANLLQYKQVSPSQELYDEAAALHGKGFWTTGWNEQWKAPDFIYVRQIRTLDNFTPVGVMAIRIPQFMIRDQLIGPSLYPQAAIIIADGDGRILSHEDPSQYGQPSLLKQGDSSYLHASLQLSVKDWTLSILLPRADITANLQKVQRFSIWMVALSLLLIVLLLSLIARSFTNPIKQIISYMKKVRIGQLKPMPEQDRQDEIGQWIYGYNAMIFSLQEQMDTIREMEKEKNDLERQMLILQINPHFLYNTLDSIKWKAQAIDEPVISEMVTRLAGMFRFTLSDGNGWTTVEREIEHVKNYAAIEQLRNPGQFKMLYQIQSDLLGARMLQLMLQPLVENAIRHGMNKRTDGRGKILITAMIEDEHIAITIADNGPGAQGGQSEGIGLANVRQRLRIYFGEAYKLETESTEKGYTVKLKHPLLPADAAIEKLDRSG